MIVEPVVSCCSVFKDSLALSVIEWCGIGGARAWTMINGERIAPLLHPACYKRWLKADGGCLWQSYYQSIKMTYYYSPGFSAWENLKEFAARWLPLTILFDSACLLRSDVPD